MRNFLLLALLLTAALSAGCTTKAWYAGVQAGAELNCKQQPVNEIACCHERMNNLSNDEYQKIRSGKDQ